MKYRGVAYYPEYWPEERWAEDIRLMKEAHINMVRVGEFAWTALEPAEGLFEFGWMHRLVSAMGDAGINVLMCTPTAAPPAWITTLYPEVRLTNGLREPLEHGIRRHYCPTSPVYRRHCNRIAAAMAREFSKYPNVIAWQIDNELGPERGSCHCEHCQGQFRHWLRERYETLNELNKRWGTRFWSGDYTSWNQVRLPVKDMSPSITMDARKFLSDVFVDFAADQYTIIKVNHPDALVTTNGMGPLFEPIDYYDLFSKMDVAAVDQYFDISDMPGNAICCDSFRGYKPGKPFWITETGSGALTADKVPEAAQIRAWAFSALARGCEGYNFFRWRTCLSGQEQELQGVIEITGKPRRRYEAVKALYSELESLWPHFENEPLPQADVAFIWSYDTDWAYKSAVIRDKIDYKPLFLEICRPFYESNVLLDVIPPGGDLSGYKLVVLPSLCVVDEKLTVNLRKFVQDGGVVLSLPQLACRNNSNVYIPTPSPAGMNDLFGLSVEGGMYLRSFVGPGQSLWVPGEKYSQESPAVRLTLNGVEIEEGTHTWMEDIDLKGGTALGTYTDNTFAGSPFLVEHSYGSGHTIYCGSYPSEDLLDSIAVYALDKASVPVREHLPRWVEVIPRGRYTFIINHSSNPVEVAAEAESALVGEYRDGKAVLKAHDVCVLVGERHES